jgi:hypothetical protein
VNRARVLILGFAATALAAAASLGRDASGYTPLSPGMPIPLFVSPQALAAVNASGVEQGSEAFVTYQGIWVFETPCPATCDGANTCVVASGGDGGLGCWVRRGGFPGAGLVANWYVDSVLGSNSASCQAPGASACQDPQEIIRRIVDQPLRTTPNIYLSGSFAGGSYELTSLIGVPYQGVNIIGKRTFTGVDGGALWAGTVTGYQAWDAGAHLEGLATVAPADGGVAFPSTYTTANGYWLEDETDGGNAGLGIPVFAMTDAGSFYTSGGAPVGGFTNAQPSVGDPVRVYTTTQIATTPGANVSFTGAGAWVIENVQIGNGAHSVQVYAANGPGSGAVEFYSSLVQGLDVFSGSWLFAYGSAFTSGVRVYGHAAALTACQFDYIESREHGHVELSGWNLLSAGLMARRDGAGSIELNTGPTAAVNCINPALWIEPGGVANLQANFWSRNSTQAAVYVTTGSLGVVYAAGMAPTAVGTAPGSPFIIGGTSYASVPQTNNGVSIQVAQ